MVGTREYVFNDWLDHSTDRCQNRVDNEHEPATFSPISIHAETLKLGRGGMLSYIRNRGCKFPDGVSKFGRASCLNGFVPGYSSLGS